MDGYGGLRKGGRGEGYSEGWQVWFVKSIRESIHGREGANAPVTSIPWTITYMTRIPGCEIDPTSIAPYLREWVGSVLASCLMEEKTVTRISGRLK